MDVAATAERLVMTVRDEGEGSDVLEGLFDRDVRVVAFDRKRPLAPLERQHVVQRQRLEDRLEVVIAVGANAEHAQVEIDLRVRWKDELHDSFSAGPGEA